MHENLSRIDLCEQHWNTDADGENMKPLSDINQYHETQGPLGVRSY